MQFLNLWGFNSHSLQTVDIKSIMIRKLSYKKNYCEVMIWICLRILLTSPHGLLSFKMSSCLEPHSFFLPPDRWQKVGGFGKIN